MHKLSYKDIFLLFIILLGSIFVTRCSSGITLEATIPPSTWNSYQNRWYGFEIEYPPDSSLVENIGGSNVVIYLNSGGEPFGASDRFIVVNSRHTVSGCRDPIEGSHSVVYLIGDQRFDQTEGKSGGSPLETRWISFTTGQDEICVTLTYASKGENSAAGSGSFVNLDSAEYTSFEGVLRSFRWVEVE
jgi:hypothetical protein